MKKKEEVISFKVDEAMLEVLKSIPNRSEFIRKAIVDALGTACPLCSGSGVLTPAQYGHWKDFAVNHAITHCNECNEVHLVCSRQS